MTPSPIDRRLVELRLLGTPEQAEELDFLEDLAKWKSAGGPKKLEQHRAAERMRLYRQDYELRKELRKRL